MTHDTPSVFRLSGACYLDYMHYPLIDPQLLSSLRLTHGIFNAVVMLLLIYHGRVGIAIRRERRADRPLPFPLIRRHRKGGPVFAGLAVFGYLSGVVLVLLDTGNLLEHPYHFLVGSTIVFLIVTTVIFSRKIKGRDSPYRTPHFVIGITILIFYPVQAFLGIGVLF